ncbi:MAG: oxidoreductase [Solirubrobacterales bacterium]|nr:oxidoreductase [Solirubrobacterales bacterium]
MPAPSTATLGDLPLTRIGLGSNRLTDTAENRAFLEAAVAEGVNFIDTAHLYAGGESERAIGAALAPFASGLVVATKGGYEPGSGRPDELRIELEQSFERLRTEPITLYYLHRVDPGVPLEESLGLLAEYRDAGRIEHVGVSEMSVEQLERARAVLPIAAVQNEYSLAQRRHDDVVAYCAEQGLLFVPFYPLRGGDTPTVREIADDHGASPRQIALAWLLRRSPTVLPIPGTLSIEHLRENLAALEIELSDDEHARLTGD